MITVLEFRETNFSKLLGVTFLMSFSFVQS